MTDWREFFEGWVSMVGVHDSLRGNDFLMGSDVEPLYQAFRARREAEDKEKLTKIFGPLYCRCPDPYAGGGISCGYLGRDDVCGHPSKKPPEPECKHKDQPWYKTHGKVYYRYCPDCGEKL